MEKSLTTFVQTDSDTFRDVVQRLTGTTDPHAPPQHGPKLTRRPTSKLHERRHWTRPKLHIAKHPSNPNSYNVSPVGTPSNIFSELSITEMNCAEEDKAIKERRFYLHPSPRSSSKSRCAEPELLTLFPLQSP